MAETPREPLDRLDPADAWRPWEPSSRQPWNLKWAGHLFRRAGFGASLGELRTALRDGFPATLEKLLGGDPGAEKREQQLLGFGTTLAEKGEPDQLRAWWVYSMLFNLHPLREKMALFWHNHFATSIAKVGQSTLMFQQHQLFRRHALGRFRPFACAVCRDPAMSIWLDSDSNAKGMPNENFARELLELFTLGTGQYTENDVREAARAFTGWRTFDGNFEIDASLHDAAEKIILGKRGSWNGDDVVQIVLERPAAAMFLTRKLYRWLVSEAVEPPDRLLAPLADAFRQSDYNVAEVVRMILRSRHFYSAHAYRQRVKTPVEFAIGAIRAAATSPVPMKPLAQHIESMGQSLFAPPNVKGWVGGRNWLNTAMILARHELAYSLVLGALVDQDAGRGAPTPDQASGPVCDVVSLVGAEKLIKAQDIVSYLLDMFLQGDVPDEARTKLIAYLQTGKLRWEHKGEEQQRAEGTGTSIHAQTTNANAGASSVGPAAHPADDGVNQRIRETAHAIMTTPEYQLA
jgi:hypothetical protein